MNIGNFQQNKNTNPPTSVLKTLLLKFGPVGVKKKMYVCFLCDLDHPGHALRQSHPRLQQQLLQHPQVGELNNNTFIIL